MNEPNYNLILGLIALFIAYYYMSVETFENVNSKECSRTAIDKGIYRYHINMINRGVR